MPYFSIIVPVYNRPSEVEEFVESLCHQTYKDFELIIVEDGSTLPCADIIEKYKKEVTIRYFFKENGGRSQARNHGMKRAEGEYLVFFDSDCVIPPAYFEVVKTSLDQLYTDCYGGPDSADHSFSDLQKAINFSMTSLLTTGGIRGAKKSLEKFTPRTFNMGFSRKVYREVGNFRDMFGEDIDLSLRIREAGFNTRLIPEAFVYHKRRVSLKSFYRQVHVFGMARVDISLMHPGSLKLVHLLPSLFLVGTILLLLASLWYPAASIPLWVYFFAIFASASIRYKSPRVGTLSIITSCIQLYGYGYGFLKAYTKKIILKQLDRDSELKKYYKKK